ncbi:MAG: DUF6176 family protein [Candidatus Nanosalina sp.]
MKDAKLSRCRVRKGKTRKLREWYSELEDRSLEVRKTLEHEGMLTETAFLMEDGEETYLYVFLESKDLGEAEESGSEEKFEIDKQHHEILEDCLEGEWEELETLGHFTNPER